MTTAQATYRALLRFELEGKKPTQEERAGMFQEYKRLAKIRSQVLLRDRYRAAIKGRGTGTLEA